MLAFPLVIVALLCALFLITLLVMTRYLHAIADDLAVLSCEDCDDEAVLLGMDALPSVAFPAAQDRSDAADWVRASPFVPGKPQA